MGGASLELDFAFFHMREHSRRGLSGSKFFLDRLAPVLFAPRIEKLLELHGPGWRGCNLYLPLGVENWQALDPVGQERIIERSTDILYNCALNSMAVDRRLTGALPDFGEISYCYGHSFMAALALVLTRQIFSRHPVERIIILGETPSFPFFLEQLQQYDRPVSIQTPCPAHYEVMTYRFLYEKGMAFSNSLIQPENWSEGDLILAFSEQHERMALASPGRYCVALYNDRQHLAPDLEVLLAQAGLPGCLHTLAPILETCLLQKEGFSMPDRELPDGLQTAIPSLFNEASGNTITEPDFVRILRAGKEIGLWGAFLDKPPAGLYNT